MTDRLPLGVEGHCDSRFRALAALLARQLESGEHHGAAVAVRWRGKPVVDIWGGAAGDRPWDERTMAVSFSTTKGPSALCLHMAMERAALPYDTPVVDVWPGFASPGTAKARITIRHVLCHEAGIPQIRDEVARVEDLSDWPAMVKMIEGLEPLWEPGTANGYHAINFGWLVGELLRLIDGRTIDAFLAEEIAGPLGLDGCFIGTPASEQPRIAPLIGHGEMDASALSLVPPDSLLLRALSPPGDLVAFLNTPRGMATVGPAFSGAFTARSLATLYAALERGGSLGGTRLLKPDTLAVATTVQNTRPDRVLMMPIHWRLGFMSGGGPMSPAGPNSEAYGQAGFGGSVALADPVAEISMAIVLDKLQLDLLAGDRTKAMVVAAVQAASG